MDHALPEAIIEVERKYNRIATEIHADAFRRGI
jgi:hypothetical protein